MEHFIGPSQAANMLGVSTDTIRRWILRGQLKVYRTPSGHRRFNLTEVQSLITEGLPPANVAAQAERDAKERARLEALKLKRLAAEQAKKEARSEADKEEASTEEANPSEPINPLEENNNE